MILGIDPGLSGALVLYDPSAGTLEVDDMPTLKVAKGKGERRVIDVYALARIIDNLAPIGPTVWLEQATPRPTDGTMQAFGSGYAYGVLWGICAASFLTVETVTPPVWKRKLGLIGCTKDDSRAKASSLFPRHSLHWALKKHDGRAEAALIAHYGAQQ